MYQKNDLIESRIYSLQLGYGQFKKENVVLLYGLGYSNNIKDIKTNGKDSTRLFNGNTQDKSGSYSVFIDKQTFIPIKNNIGIYYSINPMLSYGTTNSKSNFETTNTQNDSVVKSFNTSERAFFIASLGGNFGVFYRINKYLVLTGQINVFRARIIYSKSKVYNQSNDESENSEFGFQLYGAISPNFALNDVSIGLSFIFQKQKP